MRRAWPLLLPLLLSTSLSLTGCGPSLKQLDRLASTGAINRGAPVIAHVSIDIAAPPAKVWALLVNAPQWPSWNPEISHVFVTQPLTLGTRFTWEGSTKVHSQVRLFEPERRLAWTGTAFTAKAIHTWELTSLGNGSTLVAINESMDGPLMTTLFSSQKLAASGEVWLASLKKAAERR